ncbi:alpha/beta hydrolase [Parabacteroides sp.]
METTQQKNRIILLWPNGAPTSNGLAGVELEDTPNAISNISTPSLLVYPASKPNGKAILMCPGGGLSKISIGHEGRDMAAWFNAQGITYAVLKYRMPNGHREVPLDDVRQGIRILRNYAEEWKISKVGVMGASIGGYIAGHAAVFSVDNEQPDFQILLYPVISMLPHLTHLKSRERLLGANPTHEEEMAFSLELHVNALTPPAFIALASDDEAVSPENSVLYYLALLKNKVSASLHIYPKGGHSFGFRDSFVYKHLWTEELEKWLSTIE